MSMNPARYQELERSQSGVAKKVLAAMPLQEPWSIQKVMTELMRQGHHIEHRVVLGCVSGLLDSGLIREPSRGTYVRVRVRPTIVEPKVALDVTSLVAASPTGSIAPAAVPPRKEEGHMDKLAALAADLRKLSADAATLAGRVDDVAVEVEEAMQKLRDDGGKLNALRELLKGV